jgi:hypothetical protein
MSQLDFAQGTSSGSLQIGYSFYVFRGDLSRPIRDDGGGWSRGTTTVSGDLDMDVEVLGIT